MHGLMTDNTDLRQVIRIYIGWLMYLYLSWHNRCSYRHHYMKKCEEVLRLYSKEETKQVHWLGVSLREIYVVLSFRYLAFSALFCLIFFTSCSLLLCYLSYTRNTSSCVSLSCILLCCGVFLSHFFRRISVGVCFTCSLSVAWNPSCYWLRLCLHKPRPIA